MVGTRTGRALCGLHGPQHALDTLARRCGKTFIEQVFDMYAKVLRRLEAAAAGQAHAQRCCPPISLMARHIFFALICAASSAQRGASLSR